MSERRRHAMLLPIQIALTDERLRSVMKERTCRHKRTASGMIARCQLGVFSLHLLLSIPTQASNLKHLPSFGSLYHTSWTVRDGVPSNINNLAQTTDGYLWIGTDGGLYRFDGVTFEHFQPSKGPAFLADTITALLPEPDGGLWIGYGNGGASLLKEKKLANFGKGDALGWGTVYAFARDVDGSIWAATAHGLERFDRSQWTHIGMEWNFPASHADEVYVDHQGTLWVSSGSTLTYLRRGEKQFQPTGLHFRDLVELAETQDGILLTSGIKGLVIPFLLSPNQLLSRGSPLALRSLAISVDREAMLWVATTSDGVWRLPTPRLSSWTATSAVIPKQDHFTQSDGLSGSEGLEVLEDREGDVWVATSGGLDRFRPAKFNAVPLPSGARGVVMTPAGGEGIFISTGAVSPGILHVSRNGVEPVKGAPAFLSCAYRDGTGTLWLGGINALWKFSGKQFVRVPLPPDVPYFRLVQAMVADSSGDLWVALHEGGLYRLANGKWTTGESVPGLPHSRPLVAYTDPLGRLWFGYAQNTLAMLEGGRVKTFSATHGLAVGDVTAISGRTGELWIGGTAGVQRFDGKQFQTLTATTGELRSISGIVERSNEELWLNGMSGVVRIDRTEIGRFKQSPHYQVQADLFNALDGMPGAPMPSSRLPSAVESSDGSLWFSSSSGLAWIDPDNIRTNHIVPTVLVQSVKADDKMYPSSPHLTLPNRVQDLVINYTALSLSMPERVRFRYMLENFDKDWQQAGTRRQAFYTQLPPGDYRFTVTACNNDGLWNMTGDTFGFHIAPAYYQTAWFRALAIVAGFLALVCLYQIRLGQLGRQLHVLYGERLAERTRIARELHDTLLQSFQGLILRFQAVHNMLPERPAQAMDALGIAIDRAATAITEARDAVQELRTSQMGGNDLVETLTSAGRELQADDGSGTSDGNRATFELLVEGTPRHVHPTVQDTLYRITREAVLNAFRHAGASRIEVDLRYSGRQLRLRIRDDGIGMDSKLRGREGHWGLAGMRERARTIGGHFELWSEAGQGTEVEVTIPSSIAYKSLSKATPRTDAAENGGRQ